MSTLGLRTLLPNLKRANETTTCPHCGVENNMILVPDLNHPGQYWKIESPCSCKGGIQDSRDHLDKKYQELFKEKVERINVYGVKERYVGAKVYSIFEQFVGMFKKNLGAGLFIFGAQGSGKTYAASAVAMEVARTGRSVRFVSAVTLLDEIKQTYSTGIDEQYVIDFYTAPELLVIDDLGKEQVTEWSISRLFRIIDERYSAQKSIVVTTDRTDKQLSERWAKNGDSVNGNAILRRLGETCLSVNMAEVRGDAKLC